MKALVVIFQAFFYLLEGENTGRSWGSGELKILFDMKQIF